MLCIENLSSLDLGKLFHKNCTFKAACLVDKTYGEFKIERDNFIISMHECTSGPENIN